MNRQGSDLWSRTVPHQCDSSHWSVFGVYILIEPDRECAEVLVKSSRGVLCEAEEEVVRALKEVRNLDSAFVVVCMTLERACRIGEMRDLIRRRTGLITCSFSFNYAFDALVELLGDFSLPVIGCCYMYDDVDEDGVLVERNTVSMRLVQGDGRSAAVRWGTEYVEPALPLKRVSESGLFWSVACLERGEVIEHLYMIYSRALIPSMKRLIRRRDGTRSFVLQ